MINQKDISVRGKSLDLRGKCLIFEKIHATPWSKYQSGYSSSLACRTKVLVTKQYLGQSTFQLDHPDSGCHWTSIVWQNFCLMNHKLWYNLESRPAMRILLAGELRNSLGTLLQSYLVKNPNWHSLSYSGGELQNFFEGSLMLLSQSMSFQQNVENQKC